MKFRYLASIFLIASVSIPQIVSANALTIDETKKIASSDAAKVAEIEVIHAANSKAVHDFGILISAQTPAEIQQKLSSVSGRLSGGSSGPRAFAMSASTAE